MTYSSHSNRCIRIATRQSPLAIAQAQSIANILHASHIPTTLVPLTTRGDQGFYGNKDTFTKEIQRAVLDQEADCAVHCAKDMPPQSPDGLMIAAIGKREDPRDARIYLKDTPPEYTHCPTQTPHNHAISVSIGTSSTRRSNWIRFHAPQSRIVPIRGNLNTRIAKLHQKECHQLILAMAGIRRIQSSQMDQDLFKHCIIQPIHPSTLVPCAGQGSLLVECRKDDEACIMLLKKTIHCHESAHAIELERRITSDLGLDCQSSVGVYAHHTHAHQWHLRIAMYHHQQIDVRQKKGSLEELSGCGSAW